MTSFEDTVNIQYRNQDLICISPEVILSLYLYPLRIVDEAGEDDDAEDAIQKQHMSPLTRRLLAFRYVFIEKGVCRYDIRELVLDLYSEVL